MPLSTELPRKLQPLARRNAFLATHGGSRAEEAQLIKALQAALERREQERTSADARVAEEEKRRTQERPASIETLAGPELSGRPDLKTTQGKELVEPERHGLNDAAQQQPGRQGAPVGETATASDRATGQNANLERHKDSDKELPPKRAPALSGQLSTKRDPSRISPPGTEHKGIFGESLDVNYSYYILRIIIAILAAASILIYFRLVVWNSETERLAATNLNYFIKSGVSFSELSDVKPTYGIEGTGVVVSSVEHGSTAEIAGVKSGFLLVSIGNKFVRTIQDLTSTVEDLTRRGEKRSMFGFRDPNRSGITVFIFVPLD